MDNNFLLKYIRVVINAWINVYQLPIQFVIFFIYSLIHARILIITCNNSNIISHSKVITITFKVV